MSKKYKRLHVLGDSYTTPNAFVTPTNSFWGQSAKHLGVDTISNYSWPSNSFASIIHILISIQSTINWREDYILIGVPPLERLTVFDNFKDTKYNMTQIDTASWSLEKINLPCHTGLQNIHGWEAQTMVVHSDRSWTETQILGQLFLLTTWLDSVNANYLVVNLSKPLDTNNVWGPTEFLLPWAINHPRMILFKDTYYSVNENLHKPADFEQYSWSGHHGPAGNRHFYETSVKNKLC